MGFETLTVETKDGIGWLRLDRPKQANALNAALWRELREAVNTLDADPTVRVVVLSGNGRNFCAGIDLAMLGSLLGGHEDRARAAEDLRRTILDLQDVLTSVERCRVPVIAAVQGACIGAGLDLAA
ncbi:enoyl-CoA hydratase-related protein, partial [Pseudonocardia pini]|uniref:enoyl-CoA hydratase-related protein n=1 Tax=Pseudonocardia pini TaxID=2758030 RepID=UPI0015F12557